MFSPSNFFLINRDFTGIMIRKFNVKKRNRNQLPAPAEDAHLTVTFSVNALRSVSTSFSFFSLH